MSRLNFAFFLQTGKSTQETGLGLEEVMNSPNSVFIQHVYHHAGAGRRDKHCLNHHLFLISKDMQQQGAVGVVHEHGMCIEAYCEDVDDVDIKENDRKMGVKVRIISRKSTCY